MQPGLQGGGFGGVKSCLHYGLALRKGVRTGDRRQLVSKLYPKGASETLSL